MHRRFLRLGADHGPHWVRLYVHRIGDAWAAMIVADAAPPPEPGSLKGMAFFGETQDDAERLAKGYLGMREPAN